MPSLYERQATISPCVATWYVPSVLLLNTLFPALQMDLKDGTDEQYLLGRLGWMFKSTRIRMYL
jgi:hypothetical protein